MTHRGIVSIFVGVAMAAIFSATASAKGLDSKEIVTNVSFAFYVGETSFPAGSYTFAAMNIGAEGVTIRQTGAKDVTTMPVITRLARREGAAKASASSVVFDKVGDRSYLSEVWIPGREGYLVRATSEAHDHAMVNAVQ